MPSRKAGFFRWASWKVLSSVETPRALLWGLTLPPGALGGAGEQHRLPDDAPLVLRSVDDADLPALPYLLATAFGSNHGAVVSLPGHPRRRLAVLLEGERPSA